MNDNKSTHLVQGLFLGSGDRPFELSPADDAEHRATDPDGKYRIVRVSAAGARS